MGGVASAPTEAPKTPKTPQAPPKVASAPTEVPKTPKTPQAPKKNELELNSGCKNFITPKQEVVNTTPKKDIFKEVQSEKFAIQKSQSRSSLVVHNELEKSASKSRFLENVKQKKAEAEAEAKLIRAESQAKLLEEAKMAEKRKKELSESKQVNNNVNSISKKPNKQGQFEEMPKKLDEVFGSIRDAPVTPAKAPSPVPMMSSVYVDPDFDPGQKDVKGISETVKLKKSDKKPLKPEVKKEKIKFELPAKKPKRPKPKEESPPPLEEVKTPPPPKSPTPPPKAPTPPKEPTPPPPKEPTPPPPKEPTPEIPEEEPEAEVIIKPKFSPTKILPPKIGINGFNGVGRLVLRAALEIGLDVKAVNDPFVPLHYMVYMLKFDIAHSNANYHGKEMTVRESPTGKLVVNGRDIQVFAEHDVTKIPWECVGVNYVVEATEALNTKAEAGLHIKAAGSKKGMRMRQIIEMEEEGLSMNGNDPLAPLCSGCKKGKY